MLISQFVYIKTENTSTRYIHLKRNSRYHLYILFKIENHFCFKSKSINKIANKLKKPITIYQKNFHYIQELQKQAENKDSKLKNYISNNKV